MAEPFPWYLLALFELLSVLACYPSLKLNYARKWLITPFVFAVAIYLWTQSPMLADKSVAYLIGMWMAINLCILTHIVYVQPGFPDYWRRIRDGDQPPHTFGLLKKIGWSLDCMLGVRKVGWVQEPRGIVPPPPAYGSRLAFATSRMAYVVVNLVILEVATRLQIGNPSFDPSVHPSTDGSEMYSLAQGPVHRFLAVAIWGAGFLSGIRALHFMISIVVVGFVGISEQKYWPDMVGSIADCYCVRGYWGCVFFLSHSD